MPPGPTTESIIEQMHRFADDVRPQLPVGARGGTARTVA
jgi:hypothetical protein